MFCVSGTPYQIHRTTPLKNGKFRLFDMPLQKTQSADVLCDLLRHHDPYSSSRSLASASASWPATTTRSQLKLQHQDSSITARRPTPSA
jgi:hypothetical protein